MPTRQGAVAYCFSLIFAFWNITFELLCWVMITDEGSVLNTLHMVYLLIKSDLKWCIHLRRSICMYIKFKQKENPIAVSHNTVV